MLSACTTASSTDGALTTTAAYRAAVPGTSTSTSEDPSIQAAIVAASRWAETVIGAGNLLVQTYSENLPAYGGQTLMLSRRPLWAVSRILQNSTSTSSATVYSSTDFRIDKDAGFLWTDKGFPWTAQMPYQLGPDVPPNGELQPWYVEYTAGYVGPTGTTATCGTCSTSTGETLPGDVEYAVILKAREFYEGTYALKSQKIGDLSITYASEGYGAQAMLLLEPHRRTTV